MDNSSATNPQSSTPVTYTDDNIRHLSHMGWNTVRQTRPHPLFQDIGQNEYFYFVHSYYFAPKNEEIVLGVSEYPNEFACIVGKDNVFATQFHTEKSHQAGLLLLRNFLNWQI